MKRYNAYLSLVLLAVVSFLAAGCESIDRGYEKTVAATDPDRTRLDVKFKWINPQPRIRPVNEDQMYAYVRVRNSSGSDIDEFAFEDAVLDALDRRRYRITRNIDEAQFILNADLRYLGDAADKKFDAVVGGAIVGGGAGAVIGNNVGNDNATGGAAIGAAVGALLGNVIANRNKQRIYTLVVDVNMGERIKGGVNTNRSTNDQQDVRMSAGANTGGSYEGGSQRGGSAENQQVSLTEDFLYHQNRAVASAERLNLTLAEAEPALTRRISRAVASALP